MEKTIESPLGAKDSELKGWEYTIPEGMEAEIKDGKIVVREKESEDERIRKHLIKHFGQKTKEDWNGVPIIDIIAWLEKQGEQISSQTNERAWLHLVSDVLTWKDGIGQYLDDPRVKELAKKLHNEYAQKLYNSQNLANSAKSCKVEQNPAWSEEDEKMVGRIRGIIERYAFSQSAVDVNGDLCEPEFIEPDEWLKSLKERVQLRQEWSEEDESRFKFLHHLLEQNVEPHGSYCFPDVKELGYVTKQEALNMLKAFKERYTWKPSDEQIISLDTAIAWCIGDKERVALKSLLSDLKNLKG